MINAKTITDCLSSLFSPSELQVAGHTRSGYSILVSSDRFKDLPDYTRQAMVRDLLETTFDDDELAMINLVLTFTPSELEAYRQHPTLNVPHT